MRKGYHNSGYRKYNNHTITVMGKAFDSRREADRYVELCLLERQGHITNLECQKKFVLIPAQREADTVNSKGKPVQGKVIEREIAYFADFCYFDNRSQRFVVEDTKGFRTEVYKIKKKLMLYFHGIRIKEV